jgi:membrane protein
MVDIPGLIARLRRRYPWLDHVLRANESYNERHGNYYAAAMTYFSVLSVMPILMVGFALTGFVLAGNPTLFDELQDGIVKAMPGSLGTTIGDMVKTAVKARDTIGIVGLLLALYAGVGWMGSLRDALTVQWDLRPPQKPLPRKMIDDLGKLASLGLALVVSFALTAAGTGLGSYLLRLAGLAHAGWAHVLWVAATVVLSVAANWLVFGWVLARLPRERVSFRGAARGALIAAIGFEILKQAATLLLKGATASPTASVFGSIIGLLVFANLVSRLVLLAAAWTATATNTTGTAAAKRIPAPSPAVIRPVVVSRRGVSPAGVAALLAAGALVGSIVGPRFGAARRRLSVGSESGLDHQGE